VVRLAHASLRKALLVRGQWIDDDVRASGLGATGLQLARPVTIAAVESLRTRRTVDVRLDARAVR
jgi:hypothetical protein